MAEPPAPAPYVFLSYASADRDQALAIADALTAAGIAVWLDRHAIAGGSAWSTAIVRGIKACAAFLVLGSERAFRSPNVQRELNLAVEENRPVLPLLLEQVTPPDDVRYALAGQQWVALLDRAGAVWLPEVLRALASLGLVMAAAPRGAHLAAAAQVAAPRTNLPTPLTSFLGREQELAIVISLLETGRLLTLTGPGGTGKTRLALATARRVASAYADGVWFVDLSGVTDPAGVLPVIAQLLDVRESEGHSLPVSLAAYLRRKRLLLVLDNLEQVVGAAMALYDLLVEAPELTLLVTSRVLLHVEGEREYAVPPLPLPEAGAQVAPEQLGSNPSVQLLVERAQAVRPDFGLSSENAGVVVAICRRLDGLPLAIELAAARMKLLPPTQLLARLEQRLAFLTGGERNRPQRQQTLRATIQWSWDLLAPAEQVLFRRLGVFAGGFTLAAAEAVCNPAGELDVLEGLTSLVDQSLVRQREGNDEPRFSLLATLREFAIEQLDASGESDQLRQAHAAYYCALAEQAQTTAWSRGRILHEVLWPLDPARDDLFAALDWLATQAQTELGLRLAGALGWWFFIRAPGEGRRWFERLLGSPGAGEETQARAIALFNACACVSALGDTPATVAYLEEAATLLRTLENLPWLSRVLAHLSAFLPTAEVVRAHALAAEALALARVVGEPYTLAYAELFAGVLQTRSRNDPAAARAHFEAALRLAQALEADWLTQTVSRDLALNLWQEGQVEAPRRLLHEARKQLEALGDRFDATIGSIFLALLESANGEVTQAVEEWRSVLTLSRDVGNTTWPVMSLAAIAGLLTASGQPELGARLLGVIDSRWRALEVYAYWSHLFQDAYAKAGAATRAALSPDAFAQEWAAGEALSLDQAIDLALAELAALAPASSSTTGVVS